MSDVAVQADESVRVTVTPQVLTDSLDRLAVDYAGPVSGPGDRPQAAGR